MVSNTLLLSPKLGYKSPLEIFNLKTYISLDFKFFDLSINSSSLYLILSATVLIYLYNVIIMSNNNKIIINRWNYISFTFISLLKNEILGILKIKNNKYYPLIISIFFFILINNLIGLVPYSFTTTSQIIITFLLSSSIMIGVTLIGIETYNIKFFNLFIPKGIPSIILPLIFIIEIISYLSRIISLSVRLTANMVAGHTILFIISSFTIKLYMFAGIILFVPVLIMLFLLESGVSLIQAYVFMILTTTYIRDVCKS